MLRGARKRSIFPCCQHKLWLHTQNQSCEVMKINLDVCCLNRPFDDQTQDRIRLESEAILLILSHFQRGEWHCIGSQIVRHEIAQTPDSQRRERVALLADSIDEVVIVDKHELHRAQQLEKLSFQSFDALHLACAERGQADVFLTTDDHLLRVARRQAKHLHISVENPLVWLKGLGEE
jgi:predicted nucleic acid-binding protein